MKAYFLFLLISLALFSCRKEDSLVPDGNTDLIGSWVNPQYSDTLVTYTRAETLVENQFGITIKPGGNLVERQNSGWCGTPPITTADYEGTWAINNSVIEISVPFWGGISHKTWKVISLGNEKLIIYQIKEEYQSGK